MHQARTKRTRSSATQRLLHFAAQVSRIGALL